MSDRSDIEIPNTGLLPENQVEEHHDYADRPPNPRDAIMARIAANAEAQRQKELAQGEVYDQDARDKGLAFRQDEPDEAASEQSQTASEPEAERQSLVADRGPAAPAAPQTFAVDVDGQQLHVTQEQLVALARMGAVANQALWQYQQHPQPQPRAQAPVEPPRALVDENRIRETVKKFQYGTEDDAAGALTSLLADVVQRTPQAPQFDENAIINKAVARQQLMSDTQIIRTEYGDVLSDPDLSHLAALKVAQIQQRNAALGHNQSNLDIYREAGNLVLDKIGKPRPGSQVAPEQSGTAAPQAPNIVVRRAAGDIDARKRAAPRAMSQVVDRRSPAPQAPRPPTGSDIVEMMRKQRHQTSMR